jgi:hypothetical protein
MLSRIVAASIIAIVTPAAHVSPSPQPASALKTIATIRVSARCAGIITHANSAITAALSNDQVIGQTIAQLQFNRLDDGNPLHRKNALTSLGDLAKTLMQQARSGDDEVKRLRALAKEATDKNEGQSLKQFADELGGALWRQQTIARDLNGFLAYQDFHDMATMDEDQQRANEATYGAPDPFQHPEAPVGEQLGPDLAPPSLGHDPTDPTSTQQAKWAAQDFQNRIPDIERDENQAATRIDGAIAGC